MAEGITVTPKSAPAAPADQSFTKDETRGLAGFLGVGLDTTETDKAVLQSIVDYFKADTKELLPADLLAKVRSLEGRLGVPGLGERRLDKIYRYIKLQSQINSLEKQRDSEVR